MGMNMILSLIMGTLITVIVGTTVVPNYINEMKISQVEQQNLSNQELIKAAIIEYIKKEAKLPKTIAKLKEKTLKDYPDSNLNDEIYSFFIDKKTGTLKIFTKLDNSDLKYFENGFKSKDRPKCIEIVNNICKDGKWENFYLLDKDLYALIKSIKQDYSDPEYLGEFTPENIGKKDEHLKNPPKDGDKDYVVDLVTKEITEYIYDKGNDIWVENPTKIVVPSLNPSDHGVEIKNISWKFIDGLGNEVKQTHEKVVCNSNSIYEKVFVINQNTGLGEIVWVAPDSVLEIQKKIFDPNLKSELTEITTEPIFEPNNICTSNVTSMLNMFYDKKTFNQPLNRWDTSNVTGMFWMFLRVSAFNQPLNNWNTSNVTSMYGMFSNASAFNQNISNWDVSKVTNMMSMFSGAENFNQPLNNWNVSNVTDRLYMYGMFSSATNFNQDLSSWCVSKIGSKPNNFDQNTTSWNKTNRQPIWGTCPNL